jgi:hypothetical protein
VIARMIGLLNVVYDWDTGMVAAAELREYFKPILDARRHDPRDDLISLLAEAEIDGQRLTDEEIFGFLLLILSAGVETSDRPSGNLLVALLTHPQHLEEVRESKLALVHAIEEGLRWEPPTTSFIRKATVDGELGGMAVKAGEAAANRCGRRPARATREREVGAAQVAGGGAATDHHDEARQGAEDVADPVESRPGDVAAPAARTCHPCTGRSYERCTSCPRARVRCGAGAGARR